MAIPMAIDRWVGYFLCKQKMTSFRGQASWDNMMSPGGQLTVLVCHPTKKVNKAQELTYFCAIGFQMKLTLLSLVQYCFIKKEQSIYQVTSINFIFPLNWNFECEFEFSKYLRGTEYLFVIYQRSQIRILINQNIFKLGQL